jgi:hypothetical protein
MFHTPEFSPNPILTTSQPCTIRDFMNYLLYIERSAENLQFFLWYRDYARRFAAAKTADLALAPEWTQAMEDEALARIKKEHADKVRKAPRGGGGAAASIFHGTDFDKGLDMGGQGASVTVTVTDNTSQSLARQAFAAAGVKSPCKTFLSTLKINSHISVETDQLQVTIQPFRKELDRVIATYIMDGAPRQLNLSDHEQKAVLQALSSTTHPSAFRSLARQIEATLRQQAHPNFIRWSICNGNPARVSFARGLGVGLILVGIVVAIVITLSGAPRGYRALAAIAWMIGFATLMAAHKGMVSSLLLHRLPMLTE